MGLDFEDFLRSFTQYPEMSQMGLRDSIVNEIPRSIWNKHLVSIFGAISVDLFKKETTNTHTEGILENQLLSMYKTQEKVTGLFARKEKIFAKTQAAVERLIVMSYLGGKTFGDVMREGEGSDTPLEKNLRTQLLLLRDHLQKPDSAQKQTYLKQAKVVKHFFQEYFNTFPPGRQALLKKFIQKDLDQLSAYHKKMK
jgi:hypothetical protein